MNVLLIGGGGREHAIAWKLRQSPRLGRLFILPGNAGTAALGTNVPGDPCDVALALEVARREEIDLTIVGPEEPLAAGLADALQQAGRRVFGPTRSAARLESDKAFAKQLMRQHAVPTAEARIFTDYELARRYIATRDEPLVVKAAGLARGKGAVVCDEPAQAILVAERMLVERAFGDAGSCIVIEERLEGREVSLMTLVDGRTLYLLEPARDYKRLLDGDRGPNTGGMGACCPAQTIDPETLRQIEARILVPTLDALVREGLRYVGVLYAGLMLTAAGPKVLEFNCRFGDPEAQVVLARLQTDLLDVCEAVVEGRLADVQLNWDPRAAVCVVMACAGYPDQPRVGATIEGLPEAEAGGDAVVFHAGTRMCDGRIVASGGRVLGVTGMGPTLADARQRAYEVVQHIRFEGAVFRRDIGL